MSTYNYTIDFNDSEIITLQAALELLVEKCDEELKEGAKAPYLAHKETARNFDLDAELKIWISSEVNPSVSKKFNKQVNIYDLQKVLANHVLN